MMRRVLGEAIPALAVVGVVACLLWLWCYVLVPMFTDPSFMDRF